VFPGNQNLLTQIVTALRAKLRERSARRLEWTKSDYYNRIDLQELLNATSFQNKQLEARKFKDEFPSYLRSCVEYLQGLLEEVSLHSTQACDDNSLCKREWSSLTRCLTEYYYRAAMSPVYPLPLVWN